MKKTLSFILVMFVMQMFFAPPTFASTKEDKFAEKVKTEVAKLGTGKEAKIKVKLKDGTKIKGYISEINENQFVVMNSKTGQAVPVAYPQVGQAKGNNLSQGTIVFIALLAIPVVLFFLFAVSK